MKSKSIRRIRIQDSDVMVRSKGTPKRNPDYTLWEQQTHESEVRQTIGPDDMFVLGGNICLDRNTVHPNITRLLLNFGDCPLFAKFLPKMPVVDTKAQEEYIRQARRYVQLSDKDAYADGQLNARVIQHVPAYVRRAAYNHVQDIIRHAGHMWESMEEVLVIEATRGGCACKHSPHREVHPLTIDEMLNPGEQLMNPRATTFVPYGVDQLHPDQLKEIDEFWGMPTLDELNKTLDDMMAEDLPFSHDTFSWEREELYD